MSPGLQRKSEPLPPSFPAKETLSGIYLSLSAGIFIVAFFLVRFANNWSQAPSYFVWQFVCAAVATIAVSLAIPMLRLTAELEKRYSPRPWVDARVACSMSVVFGFGAFCFIGLQLQAWRSGPGGLLVISSLLGLAFLCLGLPAAVGTARAQLALLKLELELGNKTRPPRDCAKSFLYIREALGHLLLLCAFGIGSATLPVGAWQRATNQLSNDIVILFGLYWSTFLAISYVPVHLTLQRVGNAVRDQVVPELPDAREDYGSWYDDREKIGQYLGLSSSTLDAPKSALAVLAPLASAIIATLIGGGSR